MINVRKMNINRKKTANTAFYVMFLLFMQFISVTVLAAPGQSIDLTSGVIISEVESNDVNAQDLSNYYDLENDKIDVLINGSLSDVNDIDKFSYYAISGNNVKVQCNLKNIVHNNITSLDSAMDYIVFVTDNNTIWKPVGNEIVKIADDIEIAESISGLELSDVIINDISVNDYEDIVFCLNSAICTIDTNLDIFRIYSKENIETATGVQNPLITSVTIKGTTVYFTDQRSMSVLKGDLTGSALKVISDSYSLLAATVEGGAVVVERETIATKTGTFRPTYMIKVAGSTIYEDGFYISQFSSGQGGTGEITLASSDDDITYNFSTFMNASDEIINPTCLAISDSNDFDKAMFMGSFGASMGNDFDGKVYKLSSSGVATDFVTSYVDRNGNPATKGSTPEPVTGFYDVIDLKFSPAGSAFGNYLYVLSENIDDESDLGNDTDLWRIAPDGTAELFIENVMPAAGRMAFDTEGVFGNKLIIAPWGYSYDGSIVTVDSNGNIETLYTVTKNILDIAISPADSVFSGALVVTYADGTMAVIDYEPFDDTIIRSFTWATGLNNGSIPGGNIVFDYNNDMYLLAGGTSKSILKFNYQANLVNQLADLKIQPVPAIQGAVATYRVNILAEVGTSPVIIAAADNVDGIDYSLTATSSNFDEDDTVETVGFSFSDTGNFYIFSNMGGYIKVAERSSSTGVLGSFVSLSNISLANIAQTSGHSYSEILDLTVYPPSSDSQYGYLYATVSSSVNNLPEGVIPPSQLGDDVIVYLGNTTTENYSPSKALSIDDFNSVTMTISGPGLSAPISKLVPVSEIFEYELDSLDNGTYTISLESNSKYVGDYELMVTNMGAYREFLIDQNSPERTFNLINTETSQSELVRVSIAGKGQVLVSAKVNPQTNNVIELYEVQIDGSNSRTIIDVLNNDNPDNLNIRNITINDSLRSLNCHGTVDTIKTNAVRSKVISNLKLRTIENIDLPNFGLKSIIADTVGVVDPNDVNGVSDTKNTIASKYIRDLHVNNNIYNIKLFPDSYSNTFNDIIVGGRMVGCSIYARAVNDLSVANSQSHEDAMHDCDIFALKYIRNISVASGDIDESLIKVNSGYLRNLEISNGNLVNSTLNAASFLQNISIKSNTFTSNGNVNGTSLLYAGRGVKSIYIAGDFSKDSTISVPGNITRVISSGDFSGTITAYRLFNLLVGYNQSGKRLAEDSEFTGSDYTGDITTYYLINNISVTGQMRGDNTGESTINASYGNIKNVFVEDGATGYVSAGNRINSIMVGTLNGNRRRVINENADVSLKITAKNFTRLYYTGTLDATKTISGNPLIRDLVP